MSMTYDLTLNHTGMIRNALIAMPLEIDQCSLCYSVDKYPTRRPSPSNGAGDLKF